uniref:Putative secreted protein n=1 Tax=Ixodes ricinus TaxID=34613 RepID=A0A6B0UWL2_IXORI
MFFLFIIFLVFYTSHILFMDLSYSQHPYIKIFFRFSGFFTSLYYICLAPHPHTHKSLSHISLHHSRITLSNVTLSNIYINCYTFLTSLASHTHSHYPQTMDRRFDFARFRPVSRITFLCPSILDRIEQYIKLFGWQKERKQNWKVVTSSSVSI